MGDGVPGDRDLASGGRDHAAATPPGAAGREEACDSAVLPPESGSVHDDAKAGPDRNTARPATTRLIKDFC
jgi:hypothetical protein